ncbi:MAG TPA: hypothetical protein VFK57_10340 [Vicinamibacterales bacterium]|nr:hypothetical protein [Vicinamibacterales bacterium]
MPERIVALLPDVPSQRERVRLMFRDAGMFDVYAKLAAGQSSSALLHRIELPNEEVARRLRFAAAAHGLEAPSIQRYMDATPKELAAAPLLLLRAGGPGTERGHPRDGTSYDDSGACPHCGAGLVQTSPFRVRRTELPKSFLAAGIADELLLHESIAGAIASAGLRGMSLRPVLDPSGAPIPWRQVVVQATLPPMLASARGMIRGRAGAERPCARCGRDGWFNTTEDPFIPAYPRSAVDTMPDAAWTFELFGTGAWAEPVHGKRWLARRRLIVRPRVYAALQPLKLRGVRWSPVRVE